LAEKKPFLLRLDPKIHEAMQRWADDDLRSLNAHIEFVLRRALQQAGRLNPSGTPASPEQGRAEEAAPASGDKEK